MNLIFRLIWVITRGFFKPKIGYFDPSIMTFRVLPNDLDLNLHMTNSRYLSIMDLGRVDLLIRSGHIRGILDRKWQAVLGSANIRFRRSLRPFQKYHLRTHLIGVDDKWFYIEQRFESEGQLIAYGLVRAVFVGSKGSISSQDVLKALGVPQPKIPLRDSLLLWNQMEESIRLHNQPPTQENPHETI